MPLELLNRVSESSSQLSLSASQRKTNTEAYAYI
jgi:hypothetical protein